jgi:hypothetical protein
MNYTTNHDVTFNPTSTKMNPNGGSQLETHHLFHSNAMNYATNQDVSFNPTSTNMNLDGGAQLRSIMAFYEMESRKQSMKQQLNQQLPMSTLGFSRPSNNTPTTLAAVLGQIDQTVFHHQQQHDSFGALDLNPLPPLPVERTTPGTDMIHSMDEVIGFFGQPSNNSNGGPLEPIPLFVNQDKRGLELSGMEHSPAAKKQKTAGPEDDSSNFFRAYQAEQWTQRFEELCEFCKLNGHCQVPHTFTKNPALARWVKRQRYQYKLRLENKPATMTDERISVLEKIGFVWDSHVAAWEERRFELIEYKKSYGHCNVPSNYSNNRQLAVWVKRQRRQYKFFWDGKPSSMTNQRITALESIGFEWELRCRDPKN